MNTAIKNVTKIFSGLLIITSIGFADAETMEAGRKYEKLDFDPIIEKMHLSDEQSKRFTATVKKNRTERKQMKKQMREEIYSKNKAEMAEVLTPEQLQMFNIFMEENHRKRHPRKS